MAPIPVARSGGKNGSLKAKGFQLSGTQKKCLKETLMNDVDVCEMFELLLNQFGHKDTAAVDRRRLLKQCQKDTSHIFSSWPCSYFA